MHMYLRAHMLEYMYIEVRQTQTQATFTKYNAIN